MARTIASRSILPTVPRNTSCSNTVAKSPGTFENSLPASGLLVYRINSLYAGMGNASGPPDEVYIYRPGGTTTANGNLNSAPFSQESGRRMFNDDTNPYCFLSDGGDGGLFIHQVGTCDDQISFILYPEPGFLTGTLSVDAGEPDMTQAEIFLEDFVTSPATNGVFTIPYYEGIYDLTVYLEGYAMLTEPVTIDPNQISDVQLTLEYLAPPFNLQRTLSGNDLHMFWEFDDIDDEDFQYFGIYIKATSSNFSQFATTTDIEFDITLSPVLDYTFHVRANYENGLSAPSNEIYARFLDTDEPTAPELETCLTGNHPNPFNPTTQIGFSLKESSDVTLEIYNLRGQLVRTLLNRKMEAGEHTFQWNGDDNAGKNVGSGIYLYKMKAGRYTATKKMILLK